MGVLLKLPLISQVARNREQNNNISFMALIELHAQVRHTNYFLDCATSEMLRHLVPPAPPSHRTSVRPGLAVGPLMVLTPSFVLAEAAELRGLRISSPGNTNNPTTEICLSFVHYQASWQAWCMPGLCADVGGIYSLVGRMGQNK